VSLHKYKSFEPVFGHRAADFRQCPIHLRELSQAPQQTLAALQVTAVIHEHLDTLDVDKNLVHKQQLQVRSGDRLIFELASRKTRC